MFKKVDDHWGLAATLADLGNLEREQGKNAEAHAHYCESLKIFQDLSHKRGIARVMECFAGAAAAESQPARALRLAGAAAALRQSIGATLSPQEQVKLEAHLSVARQALSNDEGAKEWLAGWATPIEKVSPKRSTPPAR